MSNFLVFFWKKTCHGNITLLSCLKNLLGLLVFFFKVRHFLPINVLIYLFNSLFSSSCNVEFWFGVSPTRCISIQYSCCRKVLLKQFHLQIILHLLHLFFSDLKILKLHDLFQLKLLSFVYDCVNRIFPSCFHSFFDLVESVHRYGTQQVTKNDIFLTQKNTLQYGIRSVCYYSAKCWNDKPVDIKNSPSANFFRRKLKAFLFQNHYQS